MQRLLQLPRVLLLNCHWYRQCSGSWSWCSGGPQRFEPNGMIEKSPRLSPRPEACEAEHCLVGKLQRKQEVSRTKQILIKFWIWLVLSMRKNGPAVGALNAESPQGTFLKVPNQIVWLRNMSCSYGFAAYFAWDKRYTFPMVSACALAT